MDCCCQCILPELVRRYAALEDVLSVVDAVSQLLEADADAFLDGTVLALSAAILRRTSRSGGGDADMQIVALPCDISSGEFGRVVGTELLNLIDTVDQGNV